MPAPSRRRSGRSQPSSSTTLERIGSWSPPLRRHAAIMARRIAAQSTIHIQEIRGASSFLASSMAPTMRAGCADAAYRWITCGLQLLVEGARLRRGLHVERGKRLAAAVVRLDRLGAPLHALVAHDEVAVEA